MKTPVLVVVSGLPASGKTTVGRLLSERLGLPLIDKDEILESLFESLGCDDLDERARLSRARDEVLYALAGTARDAVLVNWWNHDSSPTRLRGINSSILEVFCECPVDVAASRFKARRRHPGHQDSKRPPEEIAESLRRMRETYLGPMHVGNLVRIDAGVERQRLAVLLERTPHDRNHTSVTLGQRGVDRCREWVARLDVPAHELAAYDMEIGSGVVRRQLMAPRGRERRMCGDSYRVKSR